VLLLLSLLLLLLSLLPAAPSKYLPLVPAHFGFPTGNTAAKAWGRGKGIRPQKKAQKRAAGRTARRQALSFAHLLFF
jgi:hypothetical protein